VPFAGRPSLIHCHRPAASFVGEPMAKRIVTVRVDDPSRHVASVSRRSPSRVPRSSVRGNADRFSRPSRSSTAGFVDLPQEAARSERHSKACQNLGFVGIICHLRPLSSSPGCSGGGAAGQLALNFGLDRVAEGARSAFCAVAPGHFV
jgi:hypothetical protein